MKLHTIPVGSIGTNCYIVSAESGGCAVVDPGAHGAKIIDYLEQNHLEPEAILLTHGHYDHIGGVKKLMARYPEAIVYIGEKDAPMLADTQKSLAVFRGGNDEEYLIGPSTPVSGGDAIPVGDLTFRVIDTPGHTAGGVAYLCESVLFSGDTLFRQNVGRCDLPGGDYETLLQSLQMLSGLAGDYTVCPGHGQETTLDYERRNNRYMQQALSHE